MISMLMLVEMVIFFGFIGIFGFYRNRKNESSEQYPIHPGLFILGKMVMGYSWITFLLQAAIQRLEVLPFPGIRLFAAAALLTLGVLFTLLAFIQLGSESRFGLPDESPALVMNGIYQFSRNPMYMGFYLVTFASLVAVPRTVNILCGLLGIITHHTVVLAEERFLRKQHGTDYEAYSRRVGRYVSIGMERIRKQS